jgi:Fur family ferric uptake transcriptional regulator
MTARISTTRPFTPVPSVKAPVKSAPGIAGRQVGGGGVSRGNAVSKSADLGKPAKFEVKFVPGVVGKAVPKAIPLPVGLSPKLELESARQNFAVYLTSKGLRLTGQRMAIFDATINRRHHFTAEELLADARAIDASVSRATVYRSLPILVESGIVREVDLGRDFKYYVCTRHQNTFQAQIACPDCDKIVEVDAPFMDWYGKAMAEKHGMELVSQRLQIIARCKDCVAKK